MKEVFNSIKTPFIKAYEKLEKAFRPVNEAIGRLIATKGFKLFKKYFSWGFVALFLILSISLPYITLQSGKSYTLFELIGAFAGKNVQLSYLSIINVICAVLPIAGLAFFLVEELALKNRKRIYVVNKIFGIVYLVLSYMLLGALLCFKPGIEGAGIETGFLMKEVGFPYIALLLAIVVLSFVFFRRGNLSGSYIVLIALSIIWLFPLLFIVFTSFREPGVHYVDTFFPGAGEWTLDSYKQLFVGGEKINFDFGRAFLNTLVVAIGSCVLSTIIIVCTSFVLSRFKFKSKKLLIMMFLIMGMFPGFMSMIAIYYIIKGIGLSGSLFALILCYSGGSAAGYYIVKGFMDTIPRDIDEAAMIDGASKLQIFVKIILPLAKPILIYTVLMSFMSPWGDYIFASVILGDHTESYTVALTLYQMLKPAYISDWYTSFAAGAVLVAVPIAVLFIALNKYYVEGLSGSVKG